MLRGFPVEKNEDAGAREGLAADLDELGRAAAVEPRPRRRGERRQQAAVEGRVREVVPRALGPRGALQRGLQALERGAHVLGQAAVAPRHVRRAQRAELAARRAPYLFADEARAVDAEPRKRHEVVVRALRRRRLRVDALAVGAVEHAHVGREPRVEVGRGRDGRGRRDRNHVARRGAQLALERRGPAAGLGRRRARRPGRARRRGDEPLGVRAGRVDVADEQGRREVPGPREDRLPRARVLRRRRSAAGLGLAQVAEDGVPRRERPAAPAASMRAGRRRRRVLRGLRGHGLGARPSRGAPRRGQRRRRRVERRDARGEEDQWKLQMHRASGLQDMSIASTFWPRKFNTLQLEGQAVLWAAP